MTVKDPGQHAQDVADSLPSPTDAQRKLRAWAAARAAEAPRISPADAAPLVAIFRGAIPRAEAVDARAS